MEKEVLVAIVSATAVVSSTIVAGIFGIIGNRRRKREEASKREPMTQMRLFDKDLFSKSEYWVNYTIKRLGFEQGDRNWIYETIMRVKILTISRKTKEFLQENDLLELSNAKFENLVFKLVSDIVESYNNETKEEFKKYFGKVKGEKIFNLVMNKESTKCSQSVGFNVWHAPTISYLEKSIADHCAAYYPNNVEKMETILDEFKCATAAAHTHLFKTFANFNGELDHLLE